MNEYNNLPDDLRRYLEKHGWHFSEKLCEFAVAAMYGNDEEKIREKALSAGFVRTLLKHNGVTLENDKGFDAVYVANMGRSDYLGDSVPDQKHLARYIKNYLDDEDGYEGVALSRYLADCIGKRVKINWDLYI